MSQRSGAGRKAIGRHPNNRDSLGLVEARRENTVLVIVSFGMLFSLLAVGGAIRALIRRKEDEDKPLGDGGGRLRSIFEQVFAPAEEAPVVSSIPATMPTVGLKPGVRSIIPQGVPVQPAPVVQAPTSKSNRELKSSKTATYTLSTSTISRVFDAGSQRHWSVEIRNIGPPGSRAWITTDSNLTSFPSAAAFIPAGAFSTFKVRPGDALFGMGDVEGVQVSVISSEDVA